MKLTRFILCPDSPWGSPLRSDTLCGLVLCRIAERDGPEKCRAAIEAFRAGEPPFALSSAMPKDCLPMPALPPAPRAAFREWAGSGPLSLFDALQAFKKFRKEAWLPLALWEKHAADLSLQKLFAAWREKQAREAGKRDEEKPKTGFEPHVAISRAAGGAQQGGLFFTRLSYFPTDAAFHLYARASDPGDLLELLKLVGTIGFGQDASTGKGRFSVALDGDFRPETLEPPGQNDAETGASLLLSVCAAPGMAGVEGCYKMEVKHGKAGPGAPNPFKNPILFISEGALLRRLPQGPYVLEHVNQDPSVVQIMEPLVLPCRTSTPLSDEEEAS